MNYEFQGWEELGDHRCLRVELDSFAGARPENKNRIRFWIDMERGGHPLRVEQYRRGRLAMRYDHIKLQQFKDAKGFSIWLPVSGQVESFMGTAVRDGKREIAFHPKPVMVESYRVITGSVLINQGLRDTDLTLAANTSKFSDFGKFKGGEEERRRLFSIDPKAVQKRLDDALAEADSKARRLEASAPERANWDSSTLLSLGLPALGTALLCWAGIRKWRDR